MPTFLKVPLQNVPPKAFKAAGGSDLVPTQSPGVTVVSVFVANTAVTR